MDCVLSNFLVSTLFVFLCCLFVIGYFTMSFLRCATFPIFAFGLVGTVYFSFYCQLIIKLIRYFCPFITWIFIVLSLLCHANIKLHKREFVRCINAIILLFFISKSNPLSCRAICRLTSLIDEDKVKPLAIRLGLIHF